MALNAKLKAQIEADTTMSAEYKATLMATLADASPEFQNNWMAQADYTREMNKLKEDKTTWTKFHEDTKAAKTAWEESVRKSEEAVVAANARIAELEKTGGGGTPTEQVAVMKELEGLKTLVTDLTGKFSGVVTSEDLKTYGNNSMGFVVEQMLSLGEIAEKHLEQFGTRYTRSDREALIEYANKKAVELKHPVSLEEAYGMKHGEDLEKKKIDAAKAEWEKDYRTKNMLPGAGEGGVGTGGGEKGPLEIRLEQDRQRAAGGSGAAVGPKDWQAAVIEAGQELISEGKG